jgi:putative addiction module component (TIGR02574 family)
MVYAMLEADEENDGPYQLTPEQEAMLAERMDKYKKGLMKFSSWEEVEQRILSRVKNGV